MEQLTGDAKIDRPVRLCVDKGVVFLRSRGLPSVACPLADLSETGCCCVVPLNKLDESTADRWQAKFEPGRQMSIDISAPPFLPGLHLDVEIKHTDKSKSGVVEIGLQFLNVESDERAILHKALVAFATSKLDSTVNAKSPDNTNGNGVKRGSDIFPAPAEVHQDGNSNSNGSVKPGPTDSQTIRIVKNWFASPEVPRAPQERKESLPILDSPNDPYKGKRLGEILVALGKVTEEEVAIAYKATHSVGEKLGRYLLRGGWISPIELCSALSLQSGLPITDLSAVQVPPALASMFSYLTMLKHQMVPFEESATEVCIAATHPLPASLIVEMGQRCKKSVRVFLAEDDLVVKLLHSLQPAKERKLRKHARVSLNVPVTIQFVNRQMETSSDIIYHGKTIDVCERGLMLCTGEDLRRRGACWKVCFTLAPHIVTAWCSMRYIREKQSADAVDYPWIYGLQILDMTEDCRKDLKEICIRVKMWNMQDQRMKRRH